MFIYRILNLRIQENKKEGEAEDEDDESSKNDLSSKKQQEKDLKELQNYWKLPAIAQFIKMFYPLLGINILTPQELEQ